MAALLISPEELAAGDQTYQWDEDVRIVPRWTTGPELRLRTGSLVVSDAFMLGDLPSPAATLPIGKHQTSFLTAAFDTPRREQPYIAVLAAAVGAIEQVTSWTEFADSFIVDSALGCLFDHADLSSIIEIFIAEDDAEYIADWVNEVKIVALEAKGAVGQSMAVAFEFGIGEGGHRLFEGRDSSGKVVAILMDLDVLRQARFRLD